MCERRRRRRERRERRNVLIRRLKAEGKSIRAIARELACDPKLVRRVLKQRPRAPAPPRPSLLDPFRPLIRELVLVKELTCVRILRDLRAVGYRGGYTILKVYIRSFRPKATRRPHLRFETDAGEQGQVDLSPYSVLLGEVPTDVVCFSLVLGFSRWQFIRFMLHAEAHAVCHCHVLAFEEAGGVPHDILYDRMKQVVLESYRDGVIFHPLFEALVAHYGFRAVPLAPGYKEGKGKVENGFKYLERSLLQGREFHDLADLNARAARWLVEEARVRIHRTTQRRPVDLLDEERPHLIALPERRFDAAVREPHVVGDDFCVAYLNHRYSVPPRYAGRQAWVRVLEGQLEIEVAGESVAMHPVCPGRFGRHILPEHEAEFRASSTSRHVLAAQFLRLGSAAEVFIEGLREAHRGAAGYHMSRILALAGRVGVPRVAEALRHASRYGAFSYQAVARIVAARPPAAPPPTVTAAASVPSAVATWLKGAGSHQRPLSDYQRLVHSVAAVLPPPATAEEDPHGDRGERPPAGVPAPPEPAPRRAKP
ncbi:MAG: IS21 family transposase [Deltaproteobacteria bacterium]|nr:IS21 family transposase [Deltaproteobacteria bacterium]